MQTFLPYADYTKSAQSLDNKRLGKQRVETLQILKALLYKNAKGWVNHPATKMWRGHEYQLAMYNIEICKEWLRRGFKDKQLEKTLRVISYYKLVDTGKPPWFGNEEFHNSHKSNLLRKNIEFYSKYNWDIPDNLEYKWS